MKEIGLLFTPENRDLVRAGSPTQLAIDWSDSTWAYLLGVVHGDGHVSSKSIGVTVGYKDQAFAELVFSLWQALGFNPKTYKCRTALRVDVHSKELATIFLQYKSGRKWAIPANLNTDQWLAGVFDTDGCVSDPSKKCAIVIALKRSGNLVLVADALEKTGMPRPLVRDRISRIKEKEYETEILAITSFANILCFSNSITLRHPKKKQRMQETLLYIESSLSQVHLWEKVADYCREPRTTEEIAAKFSISQEQARNALRLVRKNRDVEVIPPPESLKRYLVKD
jgi:hypothetical protein